jgi:DNA repair protein RadC
MTRLAAFRLVREPSFLAPAEYPASELPIRSPQDVFQRMAPFARRKPVEVFWLLPLDARHRLVRGAPIAVSRGILNSALVHPREVFLHAILSCAAAVIFVHNHPSGDPTPSAEDRALTQQLVAAGKLLDIPVLDHVIIGTERFVSLAETGLCSGG